MAMNRDKRPQDQGDELDEHTVFINRCAKTVKGGRRMSFAALVVIGFVGDNNIRRILIRMFLYCAMAVVWNLMSGYTGMTSLGQQAFVGIAGYSMAVMTATYLTSYWVGLLVGGVIGAALALVLAIILFRMRGMLLFWDIMNEMMVSKIS